MMASFAHSQSVCRMGWHYGTHAKYANTNFISLIGGFCMKPHSKPILSIWLCHLIPLPLVRPIFKVDVQLLKNEFVDDYGRLIECCMCLIWQRWETNGHQCVKHLKGTSEIMQWFIWGIAQKWQGLWYGSYNILRAMDGWHHHQGAPHRRG